MPSWVAGGTPEHDMNRLESVCPLTAGRMPALRSHRQLPVGSAGREALIRGTVMGQGEWERLL